MKTKNLIIVFCLWAYSTKAQIHFEVTAGINNGNFITKADGENIKYNKPDIGYIVTGNAYIPLSTNLLIQTGLQYESVHSKLNYIKSYVSNDMITTRTIIGTSYINYINIPVKLFYVIPAGKSYFNFGAGPYLGIGISGRTKAYDKFEITEDGVTTKTWEYNHNTKREFGSAATTLKRIGLGAGINASYILAKSVSFNLYSNIGLTNQSNSGKSKSITYGVGIGYIFGKRK
ncbi:MAG: PorT family protein [Chitinophagaceae bacterium]|nr:PorT family protein [Chitinophagaceae bacterium]